MKKLILLLFFVSINLSFSQEKTTLTDSLTKRFNKLWDSNDISAMVSMIQPTAFFESPYQLRYGRDTMEITVLKTNPPVYKDVKSTEKYSHVESNIAWSLGNLSANIYDENGKKTGKILNSSYTFVFTREGGKEWKLQMMILFDK